MKCKNCGEPIKKVMGQWAHIVTKGSYGYEQMYTYCQTSTKAEPPPNEAVRHFDYKKLSPFEVKHAN